MFIYKKNLQYPVRIANPNPALAKVIISQYGGPNGELGASLRYLSQRFAMPSDEVKGILTDIGTEELGHLEMVGSIVHQLTRNLTPEEIKAQGFDAYFVDHTLGVFPQAAAGVPWNAISIGVSGDVIADLTEDLAAERAVTDATNELLKKNAATLKQGTIEIAKESERGIVDIETLQQTNKQLIETLDELNKIRADGKAKRANAEQELGRIEGELRQKMLEINN